MHWKCRKNSEGCFDERKVGQRKENHIRQWQGRNSFGNDKAGIQECISDMVWMEQAGEGTSETWSKSSSQGKTVVAGLRKLGNFD